MKRAILAIIAAAVSYTHLDVYKRQHRLPLPYERLAPIYPQIISASRFKEFYVGCTKGSDLPLAEALLNFNSGYDWRRSKYLADENRHLFEEHIIGAFLYACRKLESAERCV